jgi:hypothetical protein
LGYSTCVGELRKAYQILVRRSEGKKPLERLVTDGMIILIF